jgi:hypothetical protein
MPEHESMRQRTARPNLRTNRYVDRYGRTGSDEMPRQGVIVSLLFVSFLLMHNPALGLLL